MVIVRFYFMWGVRAETANRRGTLVTGGFSQGGCRGHATGWFEIYRWVDHRGGLKVYIRVGLNGYWGLIGLGSACGCKWG
jgi:hypothetical protein